MKFLVTALLALSFVSQAALASGYGGYDQEPVEVSSVEIDLTGDLAPTCEESRETIMSKVSINGCEDRYEFNDKCECIDVDGADFCEFTTTVSCTPYYEYYY